MEPLQAVAEAHRRHGDPVRRHRRRPDRPAAFDEARAANGPIDLLIVNAGIAESAPFHKMTRESWDRIIATNLTAAFDCAQAAIGDLLKSDNGRLVFVASVASAARRSLRRALCRLEAWPARPDAQPRRRICQDQSDRERGLPGLCRHADDRPVGRARVARSPGAARSDARSAITNMNASGRLVDPAGDRQHHRHAVPAAEPRHQRRRDHHRRRHERVSFDPATLHSRSTSCGSSRTASRRSRSTGRSGRTR